MSSSAVAAEAWRCRHWLSAAMDRAEGEADWNELMRELDAGRAQLWAGDRSCMVTQLHNAGSGVFIFVWLGGGDLAELLAMRPVVESWGRQQGATSARINGRLGWSKVLQPHGYAVDAGELRKSLT